MVHPVCIFIFSSSIYISTICKSNMYQGDICMTAHMIDRCTRNFIFFFIILHRLRGRSFWPDTVDWRSRVKRASGRITTWTILENWTKGIRIISRILLLNKALRTRICSYTILLSYPMASGQALIFPWVIKTKRHMRESLNN